MYKTNIYTINTHIYSIINLSTKVMLHIKSYPHIHNKMCIIKTTFRYIISTINSFNYNIIK